VKIKTMVRVALPLALGAVVLAGCSSSGSTSGNGGKGGGKKTIAIAYQGPLSGDNAQLGINMDNAVKLAVAQANQAGNLPFTLKFVDADDQGTPDGGPPAAQKLIGESDVLAVVGPAFSGATKASEPLFSQAHLLSVSPSATNPKLTSLGFSTFYRVVPPDDAQGKEAANYLAKVVKAKKVYSIDDKSEYGVGLSGVLEPQLKSDGVKVIHDGIPPTKDYSAEAQKVAGAHPDAVYYSGYFADFALFTKALKAAGYKGPLMGGDGDKDQQYVVQAGAANAEGTLFSCPCADATVDPKAADFAKAYKAMFNADPGTYSPEAYDAANSVISVLKSLGANATRQQVADAYKTVDFQGLTKEIKFSPNGEVSGTTIFIYEVKGGKIVVLGTTADLIKS
jgi:branched-chain amino acid transport system substrate-binding protein